MTLTFKEVKQTFINTHEARLRALFCLREYIRRTKESPYGLVTSAEVMPGRPKKLLTGDTLAKMANHEEYNPATMNRNSFYCLVWLLQMNNAWEHQDYQILLSESANHFSSAFRRFTDPQYFYEQKLVNKLVGDYQGYRWSIAKPGSLILFSLSVKYNQTIEALLTEEIIVDDALKTSEVFEGSIAFHHANQNQLYLISRIKKANQLTGIQSTIIHSYDYDKDHGQVNRMKGVVFSRYTNPYVSGVVFYRNSAPEKKFVVPDKQLDPIVQELNSISVDIAGNQNNV